LRLQAQLALKAGDSEAIRQALQEIATDAERTSHIIDQLLSLARAEVDGVAASQMERVDLAELALEVVSQYVPQALAKSIDLGFEGEHHSPPIAGYRGLLSELVANLIDNAIRYIAVGGCITASLEDPAERERVFQRFYRGDTASANGAGLGLAIVREIVERHQARVVIEDAPGGVGCQFRVSFPRPG
jgi:two-component system sensor histidine kinase TctE